MKLPQGTVFVDGILNSSDVVRQLKLIRHVNYREIETTFGISGTSIHSILHEHLTVKKICSRWIPHNLSVAQKLKKLLNDAPREAINILIHTYIIDHYKPLVRSTI